jgi:hypothetical protein
MNKICKHCSHSISPSLKGAACRVCKNGLFRYGMTRVDQIRLYESQDKKCHLCSKDINMFGHHDGGYIDHCHTTGKIRGILCQKCNTMMGHLDNQSSNIDDMLLRIKKYIVKV